MSQALVNVLFLVLGAVLGVAAERTLGERIDAFRARRRRVRAARNLSSSSHSGNQLVIGGFDPGVFVLAGYLGGAIPENRIQTRVIDTPWMSSPDARAAAERYVEELRARSDGRGFHDGRVARLNALTLGTQLTEDYGEELVIQLHFQETGYFDYLATNLLGGPFDLDSAPYLGDVTQLSASGLSNMTGIELTLLTSDGLTPVFRRAARMAILENCWQTSCGETVQVPADCDTSGRPSVFETARRGVKEELGIEASALKEVVVTALVSTFEYASPAALMFATLDLTAEEVDERLRSLQARDGWEWERHQFIEIQRPSALAEALCHEDHAWTRKSCASLMFAHGYLRDGNIAGITRELERRSEPKLAGRSIQPPPS